MKLTISDLVQQKINYLLNRFSIEWSGPAWFSRECTKKGFPSKWKLEYFLPLDLGSHSSTEWSGETFLKVSKKLYKRKPELKELCMGNIHSHHTMGAFFSGTDNTHLNESANLVGYPSLVVAGAKTTHAFSVSYIDNWEVKHIIEVKDIEVESSIEVADEWVHEANRMEKKSKKAAIVPVNQTEIWTGTSGTAVDYYERTFGMSWKEYQKLNYAEATKARKIIERGFNVRIKDDKVYADIEKASSGTVDAQIEKDLESATSPKERYKIALEAYETGFMDEDAFQAELELLASKMPQDKVAEIIAEADVENYPLGWY